MKRVIVRSLLALVVLAAVAVGVLVAIAWEAMGTAPTGARLERMKASSQWRDGIFHNEQPLWNDTMGMFSAMWDVRAERDPAGVVPTNPGAVREHARAPSQELRVTWLGHSTTLIELDGVTLLTDPIWGASPSPIPSLGPQRYYDPPIPLEDVRADAVLISHDHYDHLDFETIRRLRSRPDLTFFVPLGVGEHLAYWGVPDGQIVEMDWWQEALFRGLKIVSTPSRHASGRHVFDQNRTLWTSYAILGTQGRVLFSGDTGYFDAMETIGDKYGPFDVVMMEVGAYHAAWPDWHIGPEQAIKAHNVLRGRIFMPIHWGLFSLAMHGWTEPIERVWEAAEKSKVTFVALQPGDSFLASNPPAPQRWWPDIPWKTADQSPVVSTRAGDPNQRYPAP